MPLLSSSPVDYCGSNVSSRTSSHDTTPAAFASISQGRGHSITSCGMTRDAWLMTPNADTFDNDDATDRRLVLGDLVNRVLDKGVVISGQAMISSTDVALMTLAWRPLHTAGRTPL